MAPSEKASQSSSSDVACTHCRERKIRCDRERPRCSNCNRENAECGYQVPGKRVNHIKLLCNNVDGLEDRLINMEGQISRLVASLDKDSQPGLASPGSASPSSGSSNDSPDSSQVAGDGADKYHGPMPLSGLCQQFRESVVSSNLHHSGTSETGQNDRALENLLKRMCDLADGDHSLPQQFGGGVPRLPPKHYVMKAQAEFFRQVDYATNLFVHENFLANVNRVYAGQIRQLDEAWVICFQTIILLVLGSELLGASSSSVFGGLAGSFLLPSSAALVNSRLLTAPRLINVQALILLSVLAQQQDSQAWSELLFAQACTLAKTMGLYKAQTTPNRAGAEEQQERWMVFRSLYVRDKGFTVSRGSVSWLPDSNITPMLNVRSDQHTAYSGRLELASLQDKIYRLAHSPKPWQRSSKKVHGILTRIQHGLKDLARSHGVFETHDRSKYHAAFQLDFLSTRIGALQDSPIPPHGKLIRTDARASCLVLLLARSNCDQTVREQYDKLMLTDSSAYPPPSNADVKPRGKAVNSDDSLQPNPGGTSSLTFLCLLDAFPASAFFLLVRHLLWPSEQDDGTSAEDDLALLQKVHACYHENASLMPTGSYSGKVGSTFQLLLQVVSPLRDGKQSELVPPPPPAITLACQVGMPAATAPPAGLSDTFGSSQQPTDIEMPGFSTWPTPSNIQDLDWHNWPDFTGSDELLSPLPPPHQPESMTDAFNNLTASDPPQDLFWPLQRWETSARRKRRRTDHEAEPPLNQACVAHGGIDDFLASPEALLFPYKS